MTRALITFLLGLTLLPMPSAAVSENDRLSCVKELPNPLSLSARKDYVLTCTTRTPGLTITKITANGGRCDCRVYRSTDNMEAKTRLMSICRNSKRPCDFTEVKFETSLGDFVFTWDPDEDEFDLR